MVMTVMNGNDCFKNGNDCFKWQRPFTKGKIAASSHDVTKAPSWIFIAAILDFRTLSKRCQNFFFASNLLNNFIR